MVQPALIGAVAAQQCTVPPEVVVDVVRRGVEGVVVRSVGVDLHWTTSAIVASDDLRSARTAATTGVTGLDWTFATRRLESPSPRSLTAGARSLQMDEVIRKDPTRYNPQVEVASVRATFPADVHWSSKPVGGLVVRLYLQRWAMYGGGERLDWAVGLLRDWVFATADALGATAGFVTAVDQSESDRESPWEADQGLITAYRDVENTVWGFGWGTLLGPAPAAAIGPDALRAVATDVRELSGGRVWAQIGGDDPATVTKQELDALQSVLEPALPRA